MTHNDKDRTTACNRRCASERESREPISDVRVRGRVRRVIIAGRRNFSTYFDENKKSDNSEKNKF